MSEPGERAVMKAQAGSNVSELSTTGELERFLKAHPDAELLELLIADLAGILRGKRLVREEFATVFESGVNMPGATILLDARGYTIDSIVQGSRDGDPDMICRPIAGSLAPVPWAERPSAQVLVTMSEAGGRPFYADSRVVLERALARLREAGLTPVVAIELEFYLIEADEHGKPRPKQGHIAGTGLEQDGAQYACLDDLWDVEPFLAEVEAACRAQRVPASTAVSEFAPGQFEINLHHVPDALLACDHAMLLKRIVKGVARRHELGATFMAKPFQEHAGSGLHVHVSLLDGDGNNVFRGRDGARYSPRLALAAGGLLQTMAEGMALFAPNGNSYRRFQPGAFVPLAPNWGVNHRAVALRVPIGKPLDTRLEHRVSGADANPYLVTAAVLAGIHHGLTAGCDPGPMVEPGTVLEGRIELPIRWEAALERFAAARVLRGYLGEDFCGIYEAIRGAECRRFHAEVSDRDYAWYLRAV